MSRLYNTESLSLNELNNGFWLNFKSFENVSDYISGNYFWDGNENWMKTIATKTKAWEMVIVLKDILGYKKWVHFFVFNI